MTYVTKIRAVPGSLMLAEYTCLPCEAIYELMVPRGESGDAPELQPCPECGRDTTFTISATGIANKTRKLYAVETATPRENREIYKERPNMLNTRDLAEGKITYAEWDKKQDELRDARRHEQLVQRGLKKRRIQV